MVGLGIYEFCEHLASMVINYINLSYLLCFELLLANSMLLINQKMWKLCVSEKHINTLCCHRIHYGKVQESGGNHCYFFK